MFPTLIKLGPITIHTYGFLMAVGVACGLWFLFVQARKHGLDGGKLVDMAFYTIIIALVGAKLVLLVGNFSYYTRNPGELLNIARSGGVFQGGLFFGLVFALWYMRKKKLPTWKTADIIVPALALGHGFGRIGCFTAGCCWGRSCDLPWGVTFTNAHAHDLTGIPLNIARHPTQLYEALLNWMNFLILFVLLKKKRFDGQVFAFYIINYSIIRYFVEFYRGDHDPDKTYLLHSASPYLSISYPQVFCLVGLVVGIVLYFLLRKRQVA